MGNQVTFSWSAGSDPEGGVSGYDLQIGTTEDGFDLFDSTVTGTSKTITGLPSGTTVYARVRQINNAGIHGPYSSSSAAVLTLNPSEDNDGDGQSNGSEHTAGTNPLDPASGLNVTAASISGNQVVISVATVQGKTYQLEASTTLSGTTWQNVGDPVTATGASHDFEVTYDPRQSRRFFRARVVSPVSP